MKPQYLKGEVTLRKGDGEERELGPCPHTIAFIQTLYEFEFRQILGSGFSHL